MGDDGRPRYFDFEKFERSQQFGAMADDFPLEGNRDTSGPSGGCPSASCSFHVTVERSLFESAGFSLRYHATGIDVPVDFTEALTGQIVGDHLAVEYTLTGSWGPLPANVEASGQLVRQ